MGENLLVGCITLAVCLLIQCIVVSILLRLLLVFEKKRFMRPGMAGVATGLMATLLIMFAGNLLQMAVWGGVFYHYGEFDDFPAAFYHSAVNFTTLGYGDVVMSEGRRLLGALEAGNGVLMFGLTTGLLYAVMNGLIKRALEKRIGRTK